MALTRRQVTEYCADRIVAGDDTTKVISQLAAYLITHRQISAAQRYVADLEAALARRGQLVVDVISARALDAQLREVIIKFAADGVTNVSLREQIDPGIIGGVIIKTPAQTFDGSVRTMLRRLKTS